MPNRDDLRVGLINGERAPSKDLPCYAVICSWMGLSIWGFESKMPLKYEGITPFQYKRACTDVPCCIFFLACSVFMLWVWVYAYMNGSDVLIDGAVDFNGKSCYAGLLYEEGEDVAFAPDLNYDSVLMCAANCSVTSDPSQMNNQGTPLTTYTSTVDDSGYCQPDHNATTHVTSYTDKWFQTYVHDLNQSGTLILIAFGGCIVLTALYVFLISHCAYVLVWSSIFFIIGGGVFLGVWLWQNSTLEIGEIENQKTQKWIAGLLWACIGLFTCFVGCCCGRIELAIEVVEASMHCISEMPAMFIFCLVNGSVALLFFAGWSIALIWMASIKVESVITPSTLVGLTIQGQTIGETYKKFDWQGNEDTSFGISNDFLLVLHFVYLYLMIDFLLYLTYTILASVMGDWYFTRRVDRKSKNSPKVRGSRQDELGNHPILDAIWRTLRYNAGTIVFAAVCLTIVQAVRAFLQWIEDKVSHQGANCFAKVVFGIIRCCLCCCQKCLDFFNRHALIYTAVYGYAFCPAGVRAFKIVWENFARVAVVHMVGGLVSKFGKLAIILGTCAGATVLMLFVSPWDETISYIIVPLVIVFVMAYTIACIFMSVFEIAVDVIFMCYLIDVKTFGEAKYADWAHHAFLDRHRETSHEFANRRRRARGQEEIQMM